MNSSRALFAGMTLLVFAGCGNYGRGGPDGGDNRITCTEGISAFTVTVKDGAGAVVEGATVSAKHTGTGTTVTSTTNNQGIATAVTSDTGSGTIQIRATKGTQTSTMQQVDWTCGDCTCTATPASMILIVQ